MGPEGSGAAVKSEAGPSVKPDASVKCSVVEVRNAEGDVLAVSWLYGFEVRGLKSGSSLGPENQGQTLSKKPQVVVVAELGVLVLGKRGDCM